MPTQKGESCNDQIWDNHSGANHGAKLNLLSKNEK
jgi:hypothetical protein